MIIQKSENSEKINNCMLIKTIKIKEMKTTFKITALLILVMVLGAGKTVLAVEKTKKFSEKWAAAGIENLNVSNKFGEVKIVNEGGPDVTIDVLVTVEGSNENKVTEMLNRIDVSFSKSGNTAKAETSIEDNYNFNGKFTIDYVVNIPSEKNLEISNKYGNVIVNKLTGTGRFDIKYGNITAVSLKGTKTQLNLGYGKGNITETGNLDTEISYSTISFGEIMNFRLNSKYSAIEVEKAKEVQADSKYDKLNLGELVSLTAVTKYTNIRIAKITKSLRLENGYGGIKVEEIAPDFESVNVTSSYGQISLGLNNASYTLDANCEYCGISYPQDRFKGNRMKENTSYELKGKIGTAGGGTVTVKSRYGEIKLAE